MIDGPEAGSNETQGGGPTPWARQVSNLRPLPCEGSALPLSYAPKPLCKIAEIEAAARARVAPPPSPDPKVRTFAWKELPVVWHHLADFGKGADQTGDSELDIRLELGSVGLRRDRHGVSEHLQAPWHDPVIDP